MVTYTIQVTDLEDQILSHLLRSPEVWLRRVVREKVATATNRWINQNTKYRASKLTRDEKVQLVKRKVQTVSPNPVRRR